MQQRRSKFPKLRLRQPDFPTQSLPSLPPKLNAATITAKDGGGSLLVESSGLGGTLTPLQEQTMGLCLDIAEKVFVGPLFGKLAEKLPKGSSTAKEAINVSKWISSP
jgi:hypothetical protein